MQQRIDVSPNVHKKNSLAGLFILFFSLFSFAYAQQAVAPADSLSLVSVDSLTLSAAAQDSMAKAYVFVYTDRPNRLLDSLREHITVEGNDFIRWMAFMDSLKKDQVRLGDGVPKASRPVWIVFVFLFLLVGIGLVRIFFANIFKQIVTAYYDDQALQNMGKEDSVITSWPYILLYLAFSFSLGLFLLIYISAFKIGEDVLSLQNFFKVSGLVGLLFVLKILIMRAIAGIFEIERIAREYISVLYLMYFNSMLILMPFLLIVTFSPAQHFKFLLILFLVVASVLFLYRFFATATRLLGQLKFSIFYLILYLCTLEIAPILILVKTLSN